jgi:hypothetical protein
MSIIMAHQQPGVPETNDFKLLYRVDIHKIPYSLLMIIIKVEVP